MKTAIYYFSGTGNSLAVARDIARQTEAELFPITAMGNRHNVAPSADTIGIVFPIYDFKPPNIVLNWIGTLAGIDSSYIFAVGTYGFLALQAMKVVEKAIERQGGKLSGGFLIEMPHNGIGQEAPPPDQQQIMIERCKGACRNVASYVNSGRGGTVETGRVVTDFLLSGLCIKAIPNIIRVMSHVIVKGWDSLRFVSEDSCNGCGICVKLCPVNNITLENGRPMWSDSCELCFACLQWCPKEAIQAGALTIGKRRYHHPEITVTDIIAQKKGT